MAHLHFEKLVPLALVDGANNGNSYRTVNRDRDNPVVDFDAKLLHTEGPSGEDRKLLQFRIWRKRRQGTTRALPEWTQIVLDEAGNVMALANDEREREAFAAVKVTLAAKGFVV